MKIFFLLFLLVASCRHTEVADLKPDATSLSRGMQKADELLSFGEHTELALSQDESLLVYAVKGRKAHVHEQIYIFNLVTQQERRLTWNDGVNLQPRFNQNINSVFFSSNTDLLKEHPDLLMQGEKKVGSYFRNLYELFIDSGKIKRWTQVEGRHLFPQERQGKLIFVEEVGGTYMIQSVQPIYKTQNRIVGLQYEHQSDTLVWVEDGGEEAGMELFISPFRKFDKTKLILVNGQLEILDFSVTPGYLIFASKTKGESDSKVGLYDLKEQCVRELFDFPGNDRFPVFRMSRNEVFFVNDHYGSQKVYRFSLPDLLSRTCQKTTQPLK